MEFGINQFLKFGTRSGAYSLVTEREHYDSQITATDAEADLLINYFGENDITQGNVSSNPELSRKEFLLYPSGEKIYLNLVFPKPEKHELRLYISKSAGFKPKANSVWFLFISSNDKIWIGSMSETQWRSENIGVIDDDSDSIYQSIIQENDIIKVGNLSKREVYVRDKKLALERMKIEHYTCENNPKHKLFISKYNDNPYLESHHLIPLSLQKELNTNLDFIDNIFCLCPYCHRAIHFSEPNTAKPLINNLIDKRPEVLRIVNNDEQELYRFYSLETID